jgi:hypothetical protein
MRYAVRFAQSVTALGELGPLFITDGVRIVEKWLKNFGS